MIVSSWNVNSVRARLENIKEYLKKFSPDIVLIQEIKTEDKTYPYDEIKSLGYEAERTHTPDTMIATNAPHKDVIEAVKSASAK